MLSSKAHEMVIGPSVVGNSPVPDQTEPAFGPRVDAILSPVLEEEDVGEELWTPDNNREGVDLTWTEEDELAFMEVDPLLLNSNLMEDDDLLGEDYLLEIEASLDAAETEKTMTDPIQPIDHRRKKDLADSPSLTSHAVLNTSKVVRTITAKSPTGKKARTKGVGANSSLKKVNKSESRKKIPASPRGNTVAASKKLKQFQHRISPRKRAGGTRLTNLSTFTIDLLLVEYVFGMMMFDFPLCEVLTFLVTIDMLSKSLAGLVGSQNPPSPQI
ncbi:unnamed protein product [Cochlearia groenlandica]